MSDVDNHLSAALRAANVGSVRVIHHATLARSAQTMTERLRELITAQAHALELLTKLQEAERKIRELKVSRLAS